jgi:hypothetical protein
MFRQFIGITPSAFMRLPPDSAHSVIHRTRQALNRSGEQRQE